ncbi:hypothetical protein KF728_07625 [Candidatus Obscuribacterales bacterium]|nr:hypothetical protein [Candidatus Obscuribacterales bacterium]
MTNTVQTEAKSSPLPSVGDFLFLFVMQINLFLLPNFLFAEGSTGWHLIAGEYILKTHSIPQTDLISCTFPDKAWVAYEWLFDLFIAAMNQLGGLNLLAVALSSAIGFLFLSIYDRTRREGAGIMLSFSLVLLSILVALTHWHARPHLVTFLCVWIFLTTLEDFYRGLISVRRLFLILCPGIVLWVNCHPAFPLGFVILAMYVVSAMVQASLSRTDQDRSRFKQKFFTLTALGITLSALTFVNPYGIRLHAYIFSYLQGSEILVNTQEFMSPIFKGGLHPTCLEILYFAFASGLYVSKQRISLPGLLTCLVFGHLSLSAVRNMPLYAIVVTPFIGRLWGREGAKNNLTQPQSFAQRLKKSLFDFEEQEAHCKMHVLPYAYTIFLVIVALSGGSLMGSQLLKSTFDPVYLPVETVSYIRENKVDMNRLFNFDNWGGYLRYELGERVRMDDRADFYGLPVYAKYSTVMAVGEGWQQILSEQNIDWVLFPKNSSLAAQLRASRGWTSVCKDEASELFRRVPE